MPNLLVAPQSPPGANATTSSSPLPDRFEKDVNNAGGYYADGAYVAIPDSDNISRTRTVSGNTARVDAGQSGVDLDLDPQEAYYVNLLRRFTALSIVLRSPVPAHISSSLVPVDIIHSVRKWRWVLLHRQPTMAFLSQLSQESVVNGLAALESLLQRGELRKKDGRRLGAWAWSLLAKCREVGEMGSEEVGVLRGLGKMAWWVMREMKAGIGRKEEEVVETVEVNEGIEEKEEMVEVSEEIENGVDDGVVEEGEVQSERNEQGSDDDGNDDHDVDGKNYRDIISPSHTTPTSIGNAFTATATAVDQTAIKSSPGSPNLLPTEHSNGHQHPLSSPSRHPTSNNNPSDPVLAAAQQRLLALLSPSSPSPHSSSSRERQLLSQEQEQPAPQQRISGKQTEREDHGVEEGKDEVQVETETETETQTEKQLRINATLDMILTIVGERYGQRDLLIGRGFWGE